MSGLPTPTDRPEIAFPIKATKEGPITDNPNDLQQGHFGIQTEANGGGAYYCPIANDASDPKPSPVKLNISNAVIEELVGTVDGVNKIFTIPSGAPDSDFGLAFWNGRLAYGDYTVSGDTVTFITAPATNTDVWFVYNLVLSGPGGAPLDSTNIADASTLGGPTVKDSLDTADAKIATKISQLDNIITVSPSGGDFTSVKDAIDSITDNDISNRYVVQVGPGIYSENNPIQGKEYVTIVSTGDLQTTRIVAANGSANLFEMVNLFTVKGLSLFGVTGATSYAISQTVGGTSGVNRCAFADCSNGVNINNVGASLTLENSVIFNQSLITTRAVYVQSGALKMVDLQPIIGEVTTLVEVAGATSIATINALTSLVSDVGTGLKVGDNSRCVVNNLSFASCTDGIVADGGATLKINGASIFNCDNNGFRINDVGSDTDVTLQSVNIEDSVGYDVNLLSPTCVISGDGKITIDKINRVPGVKASFVMIDQKEDDEGVNIIGELHGGTAENGAESVFGEGDSYTRGMLVYTESDANVFTDVSVLARSASGSTFTYTGTTVNSAIYIASSLENDTDFLEHYGIKTKVNTAVTAGTGEILAEYWNGASWVELNAMECDSGGQYFPHAKMYFQDSGSHHIRYDPSLAMDSWTKSDPVGAGTSYYWVRFRIATAITAAPIFEQFKLHTNRFEINADGWQEYFGRARPVGQLPFAIGQDKALSGNLGNQSLWINEDIGSGLNENSFNAVGDTIGRTFFMPQDLDTSGKIKLKIVGRPSGTGTTEFTVKWDGVTEGGNIYVANPALAPGSRSSVVSKAVTAGLATFYDFELDVSNFLSRREGGQPDVLSITIESTNLGGGAFALFAIEAEYTKWCSGGHI